MKAEKQHKVPGYNNSDELCKDIAARSNGVCLLAFSTGKDAISSWLKMKRFFKKVIPLYYYGIPKLDFVERSLNYYEQFFGERIIRLPVPNFYRQISCGVFQTQASWKITKSFQFPVFDRDWLCDELKKDLKLPGSTYTAIGNRMYDNTQRFRTITMYGPVNHNKFTFYPVYDYRIADVNKELKASGVKLPIDYTIFGKTFDGIDYRFISAIKKYFPGDYEKIKHFFPLIDTEIIRYENL